MREVFDNVLNLIEEYNQEEPITLGEISKKIKADNNKVAKMLRKMRKIGIIGFEKREIALQDQIQNFNGGYKRQRTVKCFCYFRLE